MDGWHNDVPIEGIHARRGRRRRERLLSWFIKTLLGVMLVGWVCTAAYVGWRLWLITGW